jgi:lipopolysaccharide export system protein LptA
VLNLRLSLTELAARRKNIADKGAFNQTCAIKAKTVTYSDSGAEIIVWGNVTGMTDIPCLVTTKKATVKELEEAPKTYITTQIKLNAVYTGISLEMQAVVGSNTYKIEGIDTDSPGLFTRLQVTKWGA